MDTRVAVVAFAALLLILSCFSVCDAGHQECKDAPPRMTLSTPGTTLPIETPPTFQSTSGTLYGYSYDTTHQTSNFYTINPVTGASTLVCSIKSSYVLSGSSQSTITAEGLLLFTTQDPQSSSNPLGYLVRVDPHACTQTLIPVESQTKQANFFKYDNLKGNLYGAFQNPFCIHSSLYQVDPVGGKLLRKMGNVIVGEVANERVGLDVATQSLYYTYESFTGFFLSRVDLKTGNITNSPLSFSKIGGGAQWIYDTFTLEYVPFPGAWGTGLVAGVGLFSNASSPCYPAGVFTIAPAASASMVCQYRLPASTSTVNMVSDASMSLGYLYQVFNNNTLLTFDVKNSRVVSSATCPQCSQFTAISYLEAS